MELLGIHGYVRRNFETFEFIKSATQTKLFIYTDRVQPVINLRTGICPRLTVVNHLQEKMS